MPGPAVQDTPRDAASVWAAPTAPTSTSATGALASLTPEGVERLPTFGNVVLLTSLGVGFSQEPSTF